MQDKGYSDSEEGGGNEQKDSKQDKGGESSRDIRAQAKALLQDIAEQQVQQQDKDAKAEVKEKASKAKQDKLVAIVKYEVCTAEQAAELQRLYVEIQKLTFELGTEHPRTLNILDEYACLNYGTRDFEKAAEYYRKAWEGRKRAQTSYIIEARGEVGPASHTGAIGNTLKVFNWQIFTSEYKLAKTLLELQSFGEARQLYEEALVGVEHLVQGGVYYDRNNKMQDERLEPILDGYAIALHQLGHRNKDYAEALAVYQRLLAQNSTLLGEMDPKTLSCVNRIAVVFRDMNRLAEAEAICVQSLGTCTRVLGKDHPTTQLSVEIVAFIRHSQGKSMEAEDMFRLALECNERKLGHAHPTTLGTVVKIAVLLSDQKLYDESEAMHRRALAGYEAFYGDAHELTIDEMQYIAELMLRIENIPEAEYLLRKALAGRKKLFGGTSHPKVLTSAHCLGVLVQKQTKWKHDPLIHARLKEAEALYKEATAGREAAYGESGDPYIESAAALAEFLFENDRMLEAETLWARVLKVRRKKFGDKSVETAHAAYSLGIILQTQRRFFRGIEIFAIALKGYEAVYGITEYQKNKLAKRKQMQEAKLASYENATEYEEEEDLPFEDGEEDWDTEHFMITEARGCHENCLKMNAIT